MSYISVEEMTRDEWITKAMGLIGVLVQYFPSHFEHSDTIFQRVYDLQNAQFKEKQ